MISKHIKPITMLLGTIAVFLMFASVTYGQAYQVRTSQCNGIACTVGHGSAVAIGRFQKGSEIFLTAEHVVKGGGDIWIGVSGQWVKAVRLGTYTANGADLALLGVRTEKRIITARIAEKPPARGAAVEVRGYPDGSAYRSRTARVTANRFLNDTLTVNVPAKGGESGGPILNEAGEVVGIISATDHRETLATPVSVIRNFLMAKWERLPESSQRYQRTQGIGIGIFGSQNRQRGITAQQVRDIARAEATAVVDQRVSAALGSFTDEQKAVFGATDDQLAILKATQERNSAQIVADKKEQEAKDKEQDSDRTSLLGRLKDRVLPDKVKDVFSLGTAVAAGLSTGGPVAAGLAAAGWFMRRRKTEVPKPEDDA